MQTMIPTEYTLFPQPIENPSLSSERQTERRLTELLWVLGIPIHMKGYHYLKEAVEHCIKTYATHPALTNQLYPYVASIHHTTTACVERNIRSAIEAAWKRGSLAAAAGLFGRSFNLTFYKPSNGEMIALLIERLRMDMYL